MKRSIILGLSAYYHDSAAALLVDGHLMAAAQEERFTRVKHDARFPVNAARFVLEAAAVAPGDVDIVAFYEKPLVKFERLLETYHGFAPRGFASFLKAMPLWLREKMMMRGLLHEELVSLGQGRAKLMFPEHHLSHAAAAFYPSPFEEAAILTVDGVGEWTTTSIGLGQGNRITILDELHFPHSLGLLYSAFTQYLGFRVNSGEYKLMGLAPYGSHGSERVDAFRKKILDQLIDVRADGSFVLNMPYFDYATGLRMCNEPRWKELFGLPPRRPEDPMTQEHMDLALAIQEATEEVLFLLAQTARDRTGCKNLTLAGGVALNCVANGKILRRGIFDKLWVQPAAGDAGGALGAALAAHHIGADAPRHPATGKDDMRGAFLGPAFTDGQIEAVARRYAAPHRTIADLDTLCAETARLLDEGNVVGWFQGRMEYGPRALGNRSILADPRRPDMQKKLNLKIKFREGFRPFAPAVREERCRDYFDLAVPSPYMLLVAPIGEALRCDLPPGYEDMEMYERLYVRRSDLPAVTHVDFSARVQTVGREVNEPFWKLLEAFENRTGCGVLVNTSFNVRGEPVVCTPADAYRCFMNTEMDALVMGSRLFVKAEQPPLDPSEKQEFQPD